MLHAANPWTAFLAMSQCTLKSHAMRESYARCHDNINFHETLIYQYALIYPCRDHFILTCYDALGMN